MAYLFSTYDFKIARKQFIQTGIWRKTICFSWTSILPFYVFEIINAKMYEDEENVCENVIIVQRQGIFIHSTDQVKPCHISLWLCVRVGCTVMFCQLLFIYLWKAGESLPLPPYMLWCLQTARYTRKLGSYSPAGTFYHLIIITLHMTSSDLSFEYWYCCIPWVWISRNIKIWSWMTECDITLFSSHQPLHIKGPD